MTPEDISVLCRLAGLESTCYRLFNDPASNTSIEQPRPRQLPEPSRSKDIPAGAPDGDTEGANWSIFSAAFLANGAQTTSTTNTVRLRGPARVTFFGAAGGVGTTTILATLARLYSLRGQNVALVDGSVESMLPFYFGCSGVNPASDAVLAPPKQYNGQVRLSRNPGDSATAPHFFERSLVDGGGWNGLCDESGDSLCRLGLAVVVLVPDLASVHAAGRFRKYFNELDSKGTRPVRAHYLLNQFDSIVKPHRLLFNWLKAQLGETLLPFTIGRDDIVPSCLAEGKTVFDSTAERGVATDFVALADWIQSQNMI